MGNRHFIYAKATPALLSSERVEAGVFISVNRRCSLQMMTGHNGVEPLLGMFPDQVRRDWSHLGCQHPQKFGPRITTDQLLRNLSDSAAAKLLFRIVMRGPQRGPQKTSESSVAIVVEGSDVGRQ